MAKRRLLPFGRAAGVFAAAAVGLALAACGGQAAPPAPDGAPAREDGRARRIVSLDYCADQFVLKFVDRDRILAVSPDASEDFSYLKEKAVGLPTVRPNAEDVLLLKPDLVVRSYGGGPKAAAFFERAGVPVLNVPWAARLDGEGPGTITGLIGEMADGLGAPDLGTATIAEFRARLDAVAGRKIDANVLYMTPAGVTTGPGTLVDDMLKAAGLENFQTTPGWRPLPLERLAYDPPDLVAAAFFTTLMNNRQRWSPSNHPVAQAQLRGHNVVALEGASTACGAWFVMDAVEALADAAGEMQPQRRAEGPTE